MSEESLERDVLAHVGMDRRTFVRKLILGTAFAVPVIASFEMGLLGPSSADATTSNCTTTTTDKTGTVACKPPPPPAPK